MLTSPVFYSGVLNWHVTSSVKMIGSQSDLKKIGQSSSEDESPSCSHDSSGMNGRSSLPEANDSDCSPHADGNNQRPLAFFFNHHCTCDPWFVKLAIRKEFGLNGKIMVKDNVYHNRYLSIIMGRNAIQKFFVTSSSKVQSFLDIYRDWVKSNMRSISSSSTSTSVLEATTTLKSSTSKECLMLAPSGMTTHTKYQTPMYWEYFAEKNVEKVMVHVDVQNPFGLNLRSISTSITISQILCGIMPWLSIHVTFYPKAISAYEADDGMITSQEDTDSLVSQIYTDNHDMIFCPDWKLGQRRKVDRYLQYNEYNQFYPVIFDQDGTKRSNNLLILGALGDIPTKCIPDSIRVVTSTLRGNDDICNQIQNVQPSDILLWNPPNLVDRMIAAAFDISMYIPTNSSNL